MMTVNLRKKILLIFLAAGICLSAAVAEICGLYHYTRHHASHHCDSDHVHSGGESDCPACLYTGIARNILKSASPARTQDVFAALASRTDENLKKRGSAFCAALSLVDLKVKLSS
jgi:hypothetical protein